jgi:hypothetical protein
MAAWQFDVTLVRRTSGTPVHEERAVIPVDLVKRAMAFLAERLGKPDLMLPQWWLYGTQDGNRFDVNLDDLGRAELSARLDARSDDQQFRSIVCELAQHLDCLLRCAETDSVLEPTLDGLSKALDRSRAAGFVLDPDAFLRDLAAPAAERNVH